MVGPEVPEPKQSEPTRPEKRDPSAIDLLALGVSGALCIVLATGIGYGIDSAAHTSPWLTFAGLAFGILSAVLLTVARVRQFF